MPQKLIDAAYEIKQDDSNITLGSDTTASSGNGTDEKRVFLYTVPQGVTLVFIPSSEFQLYATDNETTPAELSDYTSWRAIRKDNTGQGTLAAFSGLYLNSKFNADVNSRKKVLDRFVLREREQLEVLAIPASGKSLKPSTAKFSLTCRRIAPQLTA